MGEARFNDLVIEKSLRETEEWFSQLSEYGSKHSFTKEYSWRNKRRSFDGARICGFNLFLPTTIPVELKGIAVSAMTGELRSPSTRKINPC